jgi:hypothetical protein
MLMNEQAYIDDSLLQFRKLKDQADRAIAQVRDEDIFATLDPESNSIAIIMKHLAGNMRSRWTDFLTSDGEKPTRERDSEFEIGKSDTKQMILAAWDDGWNRVFAAISSLVPGDLDRIVTIRGEAHSVLQAINRQIAHYGVHVGQITFLAKHYAGTRWRSLSIPRGKSKEFDVSKQGKPFTV